MGGALVRRTVFAAALVMLGYLAALALWPAIRESVPRSLQWFGRPGSAASIALVLVLVIAAAVSVVRSPGVRRPGAPLAVVAGLGLVSLTLALASFWFCFDDEDDPWLFRPLMWTASVVKGGIDDHSLNGATCPSPTPVALDIARLSGLAAIFLSVVGVAAALFQSRLDRLRVHYARSVTAIVDMDDDAKSMVSAVARTLDKRSTLAVLSASPDRPCVQDARRNGARIVAVDFDRPETLRSLSLWRKLDRLYLLSADPSSNLLRLRLITERVGEDGTRQRLPLIVRIDDPWQAEAWRAQYFGGTETRWAADAVGKYEVTARELLDRILNTGTVDRIFVCGTSRLTLALLSDMAQRQLERDYYSAPDDPALPSVILVAENSEEYRQDHEHSRKHVGLDRNGFALTAIAEEPTVSALTSLIAEGDAQRSVVILVDAEGATGSAVDTTTGTRLAVRLPETPIYAWDPDAEVTQDRVPIVGRLTTYRLSMDLPGGQAQDDWERAARLIHDRYAAEIEEPTAATVPWADLDEFYRESNRRQVRNALWMVEKIGGHTWNVWGDTDSVKIPHLRDREPLEKLALMGFDRDAAMEMARTEHEDWCRYYRKNGWKYGPQRDEEHKLHPGLVEWSAIEGDSESCNKALGSLATTLTKLRELGYRSRPLRESAQWRNFRRKGAVIAEQRSAPWTWTSKSGHVMQAKAGDWEVREGTDTWSVRDDIFRSTYENIGGQRFRRCGVVKARRARDGEVVETLEGPTKPSEGGWVVEGERGERWPIPADEFEKRYDGPLPD